MLLLPADKNDPAYFLKFTEISKVVLRRSDVHLVMENLVKKVIDNLGAKGRKERQYLFQRVGK